MLHKFKLRRTLLCLFVTMGLYSHLYAAEALTDGQRQAVGQVVDEKLKNYFDSDAFSEKVDQAIVRYVEKQQKQAQAKERQAAKVAMQNVAPVSPANDYIFGNPHAEYTLIEYSDYECPFCKRFHKTAQEFIKKHPEVNWVYRHFPLEFHNPGAQTEAEAAECAGAQKGSKGFWDYSNKIFERTRSNGKGFPISRLVPLAQELGLDKAQFEKCLDSGQFKAKVAKQHDNGLAAGVTGTPGSFLVSHKTRKIISISGAQPLSALERALQQLK